MENTREHLYKTIRIGCSLYHLKSKNETKYLLYHGEYLQNIVPIILFFDIDEKHCNVVYKSCADVQLCSRVILLVER